MAFGPRDGYLYISIGDGGGADDVGLGHVEDWYAANEGGNGQDIQQNLMGDILRIDVDSGAPYGVPADNPFTGTPGCADGCDETWAYGFRNPYRFSFDMGGSRDLLVGDAGQELWEEVSLAVKGGNFGWNVKEGAHCFSTDDPGVSPDDCPDTVGAPHPRAGDPLIDPVIEYQNEHNPLGGGLGHAIVGGHVYRGDDLPRFSGDYIFGDWSREEEEGDGSLFVAQPRKIRSVEAAAAADSDEPDAPVGPLRARLRPGSGRRDVRAHHRRAGPLGNHRPRLPAGAPGPLIGDCRFLTRRCLGPRHWDAAGNGLRSGKVQPLIHHHQGGDARENCALVWLRGSGGTVG